MNQPVRNAGIFHSNNIYESYKMYSMERTTWYDTWNIMNDDEWNRLSPMFIYCFQHIYSFIASQLKSHNYQKKRKKKREPHLDEWHAITWIEMEWF